MVTTSVPLSLDTVYCAYPVNSMRFLCIEETQNFYNQSLMCGGFCQVSTESQKPEHEARERILQESDREYSLSAQISHRWTGIWRSVKRIWCSTSYILLKHWVVLQDWSLPPTHDIFVQLEILLNVRLKLGLRGRQHVWFGPLKRSDNLVHAFCFSCQFFSSDWSNSRLKKGLRMCN